MRPLGLLKNFLQMALAIIRQILGSSGRALTHSLSSPEKETFHRAKFFLLDSHDLATIESLC